MDVVRTSSFDVPHKGIRNALSQLSLMAGKVNYGNPAEVEVLGRLGKEVFEVLTSYANNEYVSFLALEEKSQGATRHDQKSLQRMHIDQARLEELLDRIVMKMREGVDVREEGHRFYFWFSDFHALCLNHMAQEERETQFLLWKYFTDEQLAGHCVAIIKMTNPRTLLLWCKYIVPAQSHDERTILMKELRANMPDYFFKDAMEHIRRFLTTNEWDILSSAVMR